MNSRISRSTFCALFDMDGVLVDTHQLVIDAYRQVGVEMPEGAWGKPWHEWLIDYFDGDIPLASDAHTKKTDVYMVWLKQGMFKPLPPADVITKLYQEWYPVGVLSGATYSAVGHISKALNIIHKNTTIRAGCSQQNKQEAIARLLLAGKTDIVYVDDDKDAGQAITEVSSARFIWYRGQTKEELMEEILWIP